MTSGFASWSGSNGSICGQKIGPLARGNLSLYITIQNNNQHLRASKNYIIKSITVANRGLERCLFGQCQPV